MQTCANYDALQVMLQLTQQSLAFQQEKSQLTDMLQAQHMQLEYLSEKTKTQEAAIDGWTEHAQQADQQVWASLRTIPDHTCREQIRK